jgi:hypothetical protein
MMEGMVTVPTDGRLSMRGGKKSAMKASVFHIVSKDRGANEKSKMKRAAF